MVGVNEKTSLLLPTPASAPISPLSNPHPHSDTPRSPSDPPPAFIYPLLLPFQAILGQTLDFCLPSPVSPISAPSGGTDPRPWSVSQWHQPGTLPPRPLGVGSRCHEGVLGSAMVIPQRGQVLAWPSMTWCSPVFIAPNMALYAPVWLCMAQYSPVWPCILQHGPICPSMALQPQYGPVLPHMFLYDPGWPYMPQYGPVCPSMM